MWYRALALFLLFLLPATSWSAVTFDASNYAQCGSCSSLSFSHTTAAGSNLSVSVSSMLYDASGIYDEVSGVTYNSVALTSKCNYSTSASVPHKDAGWWYLAAPATGTQTIVLTATDVVFSLGGGSISASGVNQSSPLRACTTATGSSTTPSETVTASAGELVIDAGTIDHAGTLTVGSGQTQRWNSIDPNGFVKFFGSTETGGSSVVMDWSNSTGTPEWIVAGTSLQAAGASGSVYRRMLRGFGQ